MRGVETQVGGDLPRMALAKYMKLGNSSQCTESADYNG
jgi:hypothetical protein